MKMSDALAFLGERGTTPRPHPPPRVEIIERPALARVTMGPSLPLPYRWEGLDRSPIVQRTMPLTLVSCPQLGFGRTNRRSMPGWLG
jgi:hypothetical protein